MQIHAIFLYFCIFHEFTHLKDPKTIRHFQEEDVGISLFSG